MKIAIIPARGGSKRIPRKNIRRFCDQPIISYSIQAALKSKCFDEVMVSTDDDEIAEVAQQWNAKVPFMRSQQAASDHASTADVIVEVLQKYQSLGVIPQFACCIYPTAPFVTPDSLQMAMAMMTNNKNIHVLNPIVRFSYPIQRAVRLKQGMIKMLQPEHVLTRSQDLEPIYHDAGQFYWIRAKEFLEMPTLLGEHTAGMVLPEWQVQDIDNEEDWIMAEMKYRILYQNEKEKITQYE